MLHNHSSTMLSLLKGLIQTEILNKSPLDNVDQQWLISQYSIQVRPLNLNWCHFTGSLFKIRLPQVLPPADEQCQLIQCY